MFAWFTGPTTIMHAGSSPRCWRPARISNYARLKLFAVFFVVRVKLPNGDLGAARGAKKQLRFLLATLGLPMDSRWPSRAAAGGADERMSHSDTHRE